MAVPSFDVLIIGAGAAGLAAAAELARSRCSVLLLEARDRIGGRIWSCEEPGLAVPVELGAEFIHGEPDATFDLMRRLGIAPVDAQGSHWTMRRGRLELRGDAFDKVRAALKAGRSRLRSHDLAFEDYLRSLPPKKLSGGARSLARTLVEGFDAADPARVSARSIVAEWVRDGALDAPQFRPLGGYGALLDRVARSFAQGNVSLQLQSVVRSLRWRKGEVEVEGTRRGETFHARARCAIVTLPLGVLQRPPGTAGAVRFDPPLTGKADALERLAPGPVLKVILRFREAFWEDAANGRCRNAAFFHAPEATFPTFWTALPIRMPALVAWAGGPGTARLSGLGRERIVQHALASARMLFGSREVRRNRLEAASFHDWQRDPYARGAYSYVQVDGGHARRELAKPLSNTLFFAGEAADTEGEAGTVAGALQTGRKAARATLRAS